MLTVALFEIFTAFSSFPVESIVLPEIVVLDVTDFTES